MKYYESLYCRVNEETLLDFSPSDINLGKDNYSCDQIIEMLQNNEINLDTIFQRQSGLWTIEQKSKFIESMMLRFPIPPLYFNVVYIDSDSKVPYWEVIDGLQRLYTIKEFALGINGNKLTLSGLDFYPELDGSNFDELPRHLVRTFKACQLQLHLVYPQTPQQVIFRIFERINTTSLKLTDQEVRNAIYQGPIVQALKSDAKYLSEQGFRITDKRYSDSELVLRFYSVYCFGVENYIGEGKLRNFLDKSMRALSKLKISEIEEISAKFRTALCDAKEILEGNAFKGSGGRFNRTIFEATLVTLAQLNDVQRLKCLQNKNLIGKCYASLINSDERFIKSTSNATSRPDNVILRYSTLKSIFLEGK